MDMDYDEAVQDLRAAHELVPDKGDDDSTDETMVEKRELQHKLQSTMQQQDLWNGGKMDQRYNEHTGFPEGRPPERDHAKILQLPIDLENREKEVKCAWLRKQFKTLVRKFHPDKYKGDKKRGSRLPTSRGTCRQHGVVSLSDFALDFPSHRCHAKYLLKYRV